VPLVAMGTLFCKGRTSQLFGHILYISPAGFRW
jgi:hypothetical protein